MPNQRRLAVLTDLREQAGLTLEEMAESCGLHGNAGRESVRAWELGNSKPRSSRRLKFMEYLWKTLRLQETPEQFAAVWDIVAQEWKWDNLSDEEWQDLRANTSPDEAARLAHKSAAKRIASSLSAPAPLPPGSRVPYQRNPKFVGRDEELHAVATALQAGSTAAIAQHGTAAATGLGGIGKTQLAVEFVHRYGHFYPGGVF